MKLEKLLSKYFSECEANKILTILKKDVLIIIDGIQGPTGKTTLCRKLNELGYCAVERREINEKRNDNTVSIVISLNKIINERVISSEIFA